MEINVLLNKDIYDMLFSRQSSFNFGVAITTISIFIALFSFATDTKFNLRWKLRKKYSLPSAFLIFFSVFLTFFAEFIKTPFWPEIVGGGLMLISLGAIFLIIFLPIKKITKNNIKILEQIINNFLIQKNKDNKYDVLKYFDDIIYFYNSLLKYSQKNKNSQIIFSQYFTSDLFLNIFSENNFLFEETIKFRIEQQKLVPKEDLRYINKFSNKLFIKLLNNESSFLNELLRENTYQDVLFYLDDIFINDKDIDFSKFLFEDISFNALNIAGKLSYIKMVDRYFNIIYRENNHYSYSDSDGYKKNIEYNDGLILSFFNCIKDFFDSSCDQKDLESLLEELSHIGHSYRWAVRTNDKSSNLRDKSGEFVYDIFSSLIQRYKIENDDIFRLKIHDIFYNFIEEQENLSESNVAYKSFIEKIKKKIIGEEYASNYKGYYPAIIRIYFYIFGYELFSNKSNDYEKTNLHLPILLKLKESLPKLYNGFKQEFYDLGVLPIGKEEKLQKEGRRIINDFLPENIEYKYEENALIFYYSGNNYGSKILLNNIVDDKIESIKIEKI